MRKAVFLDRDGVMNATVYRPEEEIYDSPYSLKELELLPGVPRAVQLIHEMGMLAIVVSNQPGVAKGKCDRPTWEGVSAEFQRRLLEQGAQPDAVYYCTHHPQSRMASLRHCDCRKPRPGLLLRASRDFGVDLGASYMVGDTERDVGAALAAGCKAVLVGDNAARPSVTPHMVAGNLLQAVQMIATGGL